MKAKLLKKLRRRYPIIYDRDEKKYLILRRFLGETTYMYTNTLIEARNLKNELILEQLQKRKRYKIIK